MGDVEFIGGHLLIFIISKEMKIFIVCSNLRFGGAERVAATLANGFFNKGHEVTLVTNLFEKINYPINPKINTVNLVTTNNNKIWKWSSSVFLLRNNIKKNQPDVIIGIMRTCGLIAKLAAIGTTTEVIMTEHNSFERPDSAPFSKTDILFKFYINKIYKHITVLTKADKKVIGNRLKEVTVMPNPLFLKPISEIPVKEKTVLAAGRIDGWHVKGFDILLLAWSKIMKNDENEKMRNANWWLKIAGAGKQESFEYLISILEDSDFKFHVSSDGQKIWRSEKYHIEFLGFQKDMESLYKKSEIFVLSSRYEGFGLVLLEAMSQGCAPIACDFKGRQKEIFEEPYPSPFPLSHQPVASPYLGRESNNEENNDIKSSINKEDFNTHNSHSSKAGIDMTDCGILCETDNVEALASALKKMMADERYRLHSQQKAIEKSHYYSISNTISRWEKYLIACKSS